MLVIVIVFFLIQGYYIRNVHLSRDDKLDNDPIFDTFSEKIQSKNVDLLLNQDISGFIYFGRDTCVDCLSFNFVLKEVIDKYDGLVIHKFDTDDWRQHEEFHTILDLYGIDNVPTLLYISDEEKISKFSFVNKTLEEIYGDIIQVLEESQETQGDGSYT